MKKWIFFFFDSVLEMVRLIPISEIIHDMYQVPKGFCPFHNDRHAGSFSIIKKSNTFYCFSCGEYGDGIKFVQMQEEIGFRKAVWKLALYFEIITPQQMEEYQKGILSNDEIKKPPRVYDGIFTDKEDSSQAPVEVLNNVYSIFSKGNSLLRKNKRLSKEHLEHLRKDRLLTDEEIEKIGFFTIPNRSNYFMKEFLKELKEEFGYEEDILKQVPGFYYMDKLKRMTFASHKGIGIPIRDEKNQIVGIQIRRDKVDVGESRYVWFSSSFANEKEGMSDGTGSGSPIHITYPKVNKRPFDLFITEGVFKSIQLSKFTKTISVSVQGVQNWKGKINKFIEYMEEEMNQAILRIHICFDSDVAENIHVYMAFREMYLSLKDEFPNIDFYYYWWDEEFGKGIDDVLLNRLGKEIKRIDCRIYVNAYDEMISELEEMYDVKRNKLDKELIRMEYQERIAPLF